jgi:hypothetical protein
MTMVTTMMVASGGNQPECGDRRVGRGRGGAGKKKQGNTGQKNARLANGWLVVAFVVVAVGIGVVSWRNSGGGDEVPGGTGTW